MTKLEKIKAAWQLKQQGQNTNQIANVLGVNYLKATHYWKAGQAIERREAHQFAHSDQAFDITL
jgi:hypothetical protein